MGEEAGMTDPSTPTRGNEAATPNLHRSMRMQEGAHLSQAILRCANLHISKLNFLREVSSILFDFCACDAVELRLSDRNLHYRWIAACRPTKSTHFERVRSASDDHGRVFAASPDDSDLELLCRHVASESFDREQACVSANGSFWTGDTWQPVELESTADGAAAGLRLLIGGHHRSLILTRFLLDDETIGLLHIKREEPHSFTAPEVEFCEEVAQAVGLAVAERRAQAALRERVKELTCLYGIAQLAEDRSLPREEVCRRIVELLPPAWQYPENAQARIHLDEQTYATPGFRESRFQQSAPIVTRERQRGTVDVVYLDEMPEFAGGVFLNEEKKLIDAVARELALIVERREAEEERARLRRQLVHADRLATVGQLTAGVAHELNEPLGSILGFAQLAKKHPDLPAHAENDIERIVNAALYAREVIKKLMLFSRQLPARATSIDINKVVDEAFYFLEAQCAKANVGIERNPAADLPPVVADPAQVKQVMVNLVVNAIQAMPDGGTVTVETWASPPRDHVYLSVRDTGMGIDPKFHEKIFLPFFTTKDVNEGTGLGLAVVHGIVSSHGGSIRVESDPGHGSCFIVCLPVRPPDTSELAEEEKDAKG